MTWQLKPTRGEYCFFYGCLALVTDTSETGFTFDCENGGWSAHYDYDTQTCLIDGQTERLPRILQSIEQPPAGLNGYNEIMSWYERRLAEGVSA